jgi:hypothetical protein
MEKRSTQTTINRARPQPDRQTDEPRKPAKKPSPQPARRYRSYLEERRPEHYAG